MDANFNARFFRSESKDIMIWFILPCLEKIHNNLTKDLSLNLLKVWCFFKTICIEKEFFFPLRPTENLHV